MEGLFFFLHLIAQGCGNLAREEHLLVRELLSRFFILCYVILDKHNYYRIFDFLINDYLRFASKPNANWSGQDVFPVLLPRHSIPSRIEITSSTFLPAHKRATPCLLPWQPPRVSTLTIVSPSTVIIISRAQTSVGW